MNQKELRELLEFLKEKGIAEFELERGDVKVKVKWPTRAPAVERAPRGLKTHVARFTAEFSPARDQSRRRGAPRTREGGARP